jgi:hypothetical protein
MLPQLEKTGSGSRSANLVGRWSLKGGPMPREHLSRDATAIVAELRLIGAKLDGIAGGLGSSGGGSGNAAILAKLGQVQTEVENMAGELDALQAEVSRNTDVDSSAITLLTGLSQKIQDLINAGSNPAQLQAFADSLKASSDSLAAAVTANTPVA